MITFCLAAIAISLSVIAWIFTIRFSSTKAKIIIIPISAFDDDIEYFVRSIVNKTKWNIRNNCENIILADMGADEETKALCKSLQDQYNFVYFCDGKDIMKDLSETLYH